MDLDEFREQLHLAGETEEEARSFIADFASVRLQYIIDRLARPALAPRPGPGAVAGLDWADPAVLRRSGIDPAWLVQVQDPSQLYIHIDFALAGTYADIEPYLDTAFVSKKERRSLFPLLSAVRPMPHDEAGVALEVSRLNRILHVAYSSGVPLATFRQYQSHLEIHGALSNLTGLIGASGSIRSILDAITQTDPNAVADITPNPLPSHINSPSDMLTYIDGGGVLPRAVLLRNHRAIVFPSDPDVVIFQTLNNNLHTAADAWSTWTRKRSINDVHLHAVGEVKTATDLSNMHERLGLAGRDTADELRTRRFLLMSVLTTSIIEGKDGRGIKRQNVGRFSDLFNLHFTWGYDGLRSRHNEHWQGFKRKVAQWCGLLK
jgi:hypothetical protein